MKRMCLACGKRPADTIEDYTPLCERCLDRAGQRVSARDRVICTIDPGCSGVVEKVVDGNIAVVATTHGGEAWLPFANIVKVAG